jgi:MarC family integral membrane protein
MVRIVGGIILMRIGFSLFMPSATASPTTITDGADGDIAFVPLAMPLMFGPGPHRPTRYRRGDTYCGFLRRYGHGADLPRRDGGDPDIFAVSDALTGVVSH